MPAEIAAPIRIATTKNSPRRVRISVRKTLVASTLPNHSQSV